MEAKRLSLSDAKARLSEVVRTVRQTGEPLVITVDGEPTVQINSIANAVRPLTRAETATLRSLFASLERIPRSSSPFDAAALVAEGRR